MKFFEEQDRARKQTKFLVGAFILALVSIVLLINAALYFALKPELYVQKNSLKKNDIVYQQTYERKIAQQKRYQEGLMILGTITSILTIGGAALFKLFQLKSGGGESVATMLGARRISENTRNYKERMFLNVVEEMSIASGTPRPSCWILDNEHSINAFAAGWSIDDAVVCVNEGTLYALTREELQGVVAHEMSHIINADMRLNIRALAVIYGLLSLTLVGEFVFRIAADMRTGKDGMPIKLAALLTGAIFFVLGWAGMIAGKIICAAISREREYLADASAIQFTRNPEGIGRALRKIAGAYEDGNVNMHSGNAKAMAHMFFTPSFLNLSSGMFATHPSLDSRIEKIYGRILPAIEPVMVEIPAEEKVNEKESLMKSGLISGGMVYGFASAGLGADPAKEQELSSKVRVNAKEAAAARKSIPIAIRSATNTGAGASAVVLALMFSGSNKESHKKLMELAHKIDYLEADELVRIDELVPEVEGLPRSWRLSILDLCNSSLKRLSLPKKEKLIEVLSNMSMADNKVSIFEKALIEILKYRLISKPFELGSVGKATLAQKSNESAKLVAWICKVSGGGDSEGKIIYDKLKPSYPFLEGKDWGTASTQISSKDWDSLRDLAPMQKPLLLRAVSAAGTHERASDAIRLVCTLLGLPVPVKHFEGLPMELIEAVS